MPTLLSQPPGTPAGTATMRIKAARIGEPEPIEIAIIQFSGGAEKYLDPRHPDAPWTTAAYWFRPLAPRSEGADTLLDIDYGITFHLRANQPYKLMVRRGDGSIVEDRFTCPVQLRKPTFKPEGWQPPAPPRGPLVAPTREAEVSPPATPASVIDASNATGAAQSSAAVQDGIVADGGPRELAPVPEPVPELVPEPIPTPTPVPTPVPNPAPTPTPSPSSLPLPKSVIALVAVLLIAGLAWKFWPHGSEPVASPDQAEKTEPKVAEKDKAPATEVKEPPAPEAPTLDSVRKFIASKPSAADAAKMAQQLADGNKLLDAQFLLLRYAADGGDIASARRIGAMYDPATYSKETSPLPAPNPGEASKWLKKAADGGDAQGQYRFGMLLKSGGTDEDNAPEKAAFYLGLAAQAGNEAARKELMGK